MYLKYSVRVFLFCICLVCFGTISVPLAQAGWWSDNVCCSSGSLVGNGDGNAGANLSGGTSGSSGGTNSYIASVSTQPIPSNARYTGQQTVNGVTYDVWEYAGSGTATGPNLVSRPVTGSNGGSNGGGSSPRPATGYFDSVTPAACSVYGWAYDPDNTNQAINVHIYRDNRAGVGTFVTSCTANQARSDVNTVAKVPGNHGFNCVLPDTYRGTGDHTLYIHAIDINGTPNNLLQTNAKVMGCAPPPAPDVSVQNFMIARACSVNDMTVNDTCPQTNISFVVRNTGNKTITAGTAVPYRVEYHLPTDTASSPWRLAKTGTYTGGVAVNSQSTTITQSVLNLPVGRSTMRVVVNPTPGVLALGETNFTNNISNTVAQTYVPANVDLSFQSFSVTDACETDVMAGNTPCPSTKVTFVLLNKGNKTITAGMAVPYVVEYQLDGSSVWKTAVTGSFTDGIAAKSGTAGVSAKIVAAVPNLKMGSTKLRAVVNPTPRAAQLNETNFTDNASSEITQTYVYEVGTVILTYKNEVIRYSATTSLQWSVDADYAVTCQLAGAFAVGVNRTLTNTPGTKISGTAGSAALKNTQNFSLTCTPKTGPGVPSTVISKSVSIEVVPSVQEI